ncbi:helix-turn-helix domain-containing protein [Neobacillus sp. NRS-1170]|uniref:helix-turn-helix domain-containing protein n=1 Tax=Neobacillus sp. NRS-1170 TaxID=3233898 RepID=UPI003D2BF137
MKKEKINYYIGDVLRPLRKAKGLSQEELAERSKLNRSYVTELETQNKNPSFYIICKLAIGLEMPVEELAKIIAEKTDIYNIYKKEPY